MRHVVYKCFTIGAYEKEEKWLNEMSARGLHLIAASAIRYEFEEGVRGEYVYRLELLEYLPSHPESAAYLRFLEETGVEQVASYLRWVYLRRKAGEGEFEIYSDLDSKIAHCKRVVAIATGVNVLLCITIATQLIAAVLQYPELIGGPVKAGKMLLPYLFSVTIPALAVLAATLVFVQVIIIPVRRASKRLAAQKKIME